MTNRKKSILNSTGCFLGSFLFFFLAYHGFKNQNINLSDYKKLTGKLISKGVDYRYNRKGFKSRCFYIYLDNLLNQKLGISRYSRNYDDLLNKFNLGDSITVFFIDRPDKGGNINLDFIQAERNGEVLVDKKEYEKDQQVIAYFALGAGLFSIGLSVYTSRKIIFKKEKISKKMKLKI